MNAEHPMQPVVLDTKDRLNMPRFKKNDIIVKLVASFEGGLNTLVLDNFSDEDWSQLGQLLGYSVSGWSDLSYVDVSDVCVAEEQAASLLKQAKSTFMKGFDEDKFNSKLFHGLISLGWRDTSYGNDSYPSLEYGKEDKNGLGVYRIYVAECIKWMREDEHDSEFTLCYRNSDSMWSTMLATDSPDALMLTVNAVMNVYNAKPTEEEMEDEAIEADKAVHGHS